MAEQVTHTIDLIRGHVENEGKPNEVRHTRVVFGHRITAKDLFQLDSDPQAQNPTQYTDCLLRASIIEFGTLRMPVPLTVLLNLVDVDREDLVDGQNIFSEMSSEGRFAEYLSDGVNLPFGFRVNDLLYTRAQFGRRLTGFDEVEADKAGLGRGVKRHCFLMARQITKLAAVEKKEDGTEVVIAELDGPIPLEEFESLDGSDVAALRGAAELWRQSFRLAGAIVSRNGRGSERVDSGNQDRLERGEDSGHAAGAA